MFNVEWRPHTQHSTFNIEHSTLLFKLATMPLIESTTTDAITTITLNRPEKLNAFAGTMREELLAALRAAEGRVLVITGAGRAFCAGGDVEFMAGLQRERNIAAFRKLLDAGRDVVIQIATMPQPVIAAINGIAAGAGCNLALACDYRIASDQAKLGETFVRIGLHPDWGGTWLLPRLVGRSRAFELLASGRIIDAQEALAIGMVDRVASDLAGEVNAFARALADGPAVAIAGIKRALAASERNDLRAQLELEAEHQASAFLSDDAAERIAAFLQKRP
jgi:2-(1,2-epoxy-1,2-dihydrophenyl)acetyl-CoA isomerase